MSVVREEEKTNYVQKNFYEKKNKVFKNGASRKKYLGKRSVTQIFIFKENAFLSCGNTTSISEIYIAKREKQTFLGERTKF